MVHKLFVLVYFLSKKSSVHEHFCSWSIIYVWFLSKVSQPKTVNIPFWQWPCFSQPSAIKPSNLIAINTRSASAMSSRATLLGMGTDRSSEEQYICSPLSRLLEEARPSMAEWWVSVTPALSDGVMNFGNAAGPGQRHHGSASGDCLGDHQSVLTGTIHSAELLGQAWGRIVNGGDRDLDGCLG